MQKESLTALVRHHLETARAASSGRSAHTVYGGHQHSLRQTLIALRAGSTLDEHENPGDSVCASSASAHPLAPRVVTETGKIPRSSRSMSNRTCRSRCATRAVCSSISSPIGSTSSAAAVVTHRQPTRSQPRRGRWLPSWASSRLR